MRGVVGWLPLTEPDVGALLERYAANPQLEGLRHRMGPGNDLHYMATSYARWVETVEKLTASLTGAERGRVMGGTAIEAYRL